VASGPNKGSSKVAGLRMSDLLELPDPSRRLLQWLMRNNDAELRDVAAGLEWDEAAARSVLASVVTQGLVQETVTPETTRYLVRLAPQRGRGSKSGLWKRIEDTSRD
jgi:predicted ArsR family transcriptional regulator